MLTRQPKRHYLDGQIHVAEFSFAVVLTTWTTHWTDARTQEKHLLKLGAHFTRIFQDSGSGFRIIGHFNSRPRLISGEI